MKALAAVVALVFAITPVAAQTAKVDVVEAAGGKGTYTHEDRLTSRLVVCMEAFKAGVTADKLSIWMKDKKFTKEASEATLDACVALATGLALAPKNPKDTA